MSGKMLASIRFGAEYSEGHVLHDRPGPQISTKIHCDFHPNTLLFSSKYTLATVASLAGSRTPPPVPGPQQGTAWRSILAATPSTAAISTPFLNGNSANPLLYSSNEERSTSTARSHGARKNHPQHPPDQKFRFFHFCKNIRVVYDFPGFVSGFCIFTGFLLVCCCT